MEGYAALKGDVSTIIDIATQGSCMSCPMEAVIMRDPRQLTTRGL